LVVETGSPRHSWVGGCHKIRPILAVGVIIFLPTFFGMTGYMLYDKIGEWKMKINKWRAKRAEGKAMAR
jgi:hypothetical protein